MTLRSLSSESGFRIQQEAPVDGGTDVVLPRARVGERLIADSPEIADPEGWVRLRFNVDEKGDVHGIRVVDSSDKDLESAAVSLLASWSYEPGTRGGAPAAFNDVEAQLTFAPAPWSLATPGQTAMLVGVIILAFALIVVIGLTTNTGFGSNGSSSRD